MKPSVPASATIVWLGLATVTSCTIGPDYAPPPVEVPAQFVAEHDLGSLSPDGPWWNAFGDEVLSGLVRRAIESNTDVRVAIARLQQARALAGLSKADYWPSIDARASYSNSHFSDNGFIKGFGAGGGTPGALFPGQQIDLHEVGLDASWEIDLFGGLRRGAESASAEVGAAHADLRLALVSMLGELTVDYCELRGRQARLTVARSLVRSQQDTMDVIAERAAAGVADDLDVARTQSRLATLSARIPELEGDIQTSIRGIETMLGVRPGTLDATLRPERPLPALPDALAVGIPSEVLARRPDVQAAERRLAAATARIGVAEADLLPRFSLTGSFGLSSQRLDELAQRDSVYWLVGPAMRWPLLDFGRVRARIDEADAKLQESLALFEGTVTSALAEVEVALVTITRDRRQLDELRKARDAAASAVTLADERHRNGVLEYLDLLDARRSFDDAADAVVVADQALAVDVVRLFKALGGGWEALEPAHGTAAGTW